jgi:hypothetical protein
MSPTLIAYIVIISYALLALAWAFSTRLKINPDKSLSALTSYSIVLLLISIYGYLPRALQTISIYGYLPRALQTILFVFMVFVLPTLGIYPFALRLFSRKH